MLQDILKVLEEDIRPILNQDGGDIEVISYIEEEGILRLRLRGQCSCCHQAQHTIDTVITKNLKEKIVGLKDIYIETGLSDEMIILAKRLLNGGTNS